MSVEFVFVYHYHRFLSLFLAILIIIFSFFLSFLLFFSFCIIIQICLTLLFFVFIAGSSAEVIIWRIDRSAAWRVLRCVALPLVSRFSRGFVMRQPLDAPSHTT